MAFETATFPNWARWFRAGNRDILLARDGAGAILAALLLDGPGATPSSSRCSAGGRHHQLRRGRTPRWKDAASAPPWWHARRRYFATAVPHLPHRLDRPRVVLRPRGYRPWLLPACASS